jgi:hypothetical protein
MNIDRYETHGRKLMVEFKCRRCGETALRPLEDCMKEMIDGYRNLYDLHPPTGWEDGGFYYPMFCPDCKKAYERFMEGGEE